MPTFPTLELELFSLGITSGSERAEAKEPNTSTMGDKMLVLGGHSN